MVITLGVTPEKEGEFNEFYNHRFLPALLASAPEISSIRRYEEINPGGTLRWYTKQYLTIYELKNEESVNNADEVFLRPGLRELITEFQTWKKNDLRNFSRISYLQRWEYDRKPSDGNYGSRPLLLWSVELKPEFDAGFQDWYENQYLPLQLADIPEWCAARRYTSVARDQTRHLTFFESPDENELTRSMLSLRALHRVSQNREWKRRVDAQAIWHDATGFRCVYLRAGL